MLFSVIVPVYNVERYLNECVDSILKQTYSEFELILIDDGSSDQSGTICDHYAQEDGRIKVIHKENGGQSSARNRGIEIACGDFFVFLDSDDFISDADFLKSLCETIDSETDIVLYRYCKLFEDGSTKDIGITFSDIDITSRTSLLKDLVMRDAFFCSCWSKSIRASIIRKHAITFDESLSCEDMDWYYNVILHAEKLKVIDRSFLCYRQRANSVTTTFKLKSVTDYILTLRKWSGILSDIEDSEIKAVMLSTLAKLYCNLLVLYSRHMAELKEYKHDIFSFRYLLKYDLNPRTRAFCKVSDIVGLDMMCSILRIIDRVR